MINYADESLFLSDSVRKQVLIEYDTGVITNAELHYESLELTESICSDENIVLGSAESSELKFKISNTLQPLKDKVLTVSITPEGGAKFQLGVFKVVSDKPSADKTEREVTAYDVLYFVLNRDVTSIYNSLRASQRTFKSFREAFFTALGVPFASQDLPNDDVVIPSGSNPNTLTGETVLKWIGEFCGALGHVNRQGIFEWKVLLPIIEGLYPSNTLYPADDLYPAEDKNVTVVDSTLYYSVQYEDYLVEKITGLIVKNAEGTIVENIGSTSNAYTVADNPFFNILSGTARHNAAVILEDTIEEVWFHPSTVELKGNPCFEVGDAFKVWTKYKLVYSYVLQRKLKGIQALIDTFEASGTQFYEVDLNSTAAQVTSIGTQVSSMGESFNNEIDRIDGEMDTIEASIQNLGDSVAIKVDKNGHVVSELNVTANGMGFVGDKVTFNTNNFKLDASGNAEFSGTLAAGVNIISPKITGGSFETTSSDNVFKTTIANGSISTSSITATNYWLPNNHYVITDLDIYEQYVHNALNATYVGSSVAGARLSDDMGAIIPTDDGVTSLGKSNRRWSQLYASTATINTSDEREKKDIKPLTDKHIQFIMSVAPKSFLFKSGTSGRTHIGFIAQEVEEAMAACGFSSLDFAGFIKSPLYDKYQEDGVSPADDAQIIDYIYGLRYEEFIGLLTLAIQKHEDRLKIIEERLGIVNE